MYLSLRFHHLLCTYNFKGLGYSPHYVKNFYKVLEELPHTPIKLDSSLDSICSACPKQNGSICETEDTVQTLDSLHKEALKLEHKQVITHAQMLDKISTLKLNTFNSICAPCSWKKLGICESNLRSTIKDFNS